MKSTTLCVTAVLSIASVGAASAQDVSWGCAFDRHSGVTVCQVVDGNPPRPTGDYVVSKPNQAIAGTFIRDDGAKVRVYTRGRNLGRQPFHWQE